MKKILKIEDIAPYEDTLITDLNFSRQIRCRLENVNCKTVAELLKSSRKKFSSFVVTTLKKFFRTSRKVVSVSSRGIVLVSNLRSKVLPFELPDVPNEKIFDKTTETSPREKILPADFTSDKLTTLRRNENFGKDALLVKCGRVLKERFPNGYKLADENFYSRFVRCLQKNFDVKTPPTRQALDAMICKIGVLCDRGKYLHPDFVNVSPDVLERVKNFVDGSERKAFFYKEIFHALKNFLVGTQITNPHFLQGVMKFHGLPYKFRKDYLTKSDEITMSTEFNRFVSERGEVTVQEIKANFFALDDANIKSLLASCPEILRLGEGKFMHAAQLNLSKDEFAPMKKFLRRQCSAPVTSRRLLDIFSEKFSDFVTRNEIHNHEKLFAVLQHMFRDDFNFSRPYISTTPIKNISHKKILLHKLIGTDAIALEDLLDICADNGIDYDSKPRLIESLRPDFVRVDEFNLRRPESIGVTEKIVAVVVKNLRAAIRRNGGFQPAKTFEDFEWLPQLETPWNSFLLESVASLDDALAKIKIPLSPMNSSATIFLAEEFAEDDYQSFLRKILLAENDKEPFRSEKEILDRLKSLGLCNKNLPKFLNGGRALAFLNE